MAEPGQAGSSSENGPPRPESASGLTIGSGFSLSFLDSAGELSGSGPPPAGSGVQTPYVLTKRIGAGGQAEVWEAWQTDLNRAVAVKIHRHGAREAFLNEALLTAELDHPNIVPVFGIDHGSEDGARQPALAMKLIRGRRWDEVLSAERAPDGRLSGESLQRHLDILQSVCRAIAYAHSRGILHLDLKPSQVMVGGFGEVYLMDWGVAARVDAESKLPVRLAASITQPSGTPGYMAPEQALGDGAAICAQTDVYLLGALAFWIASGTAPHPGATLAEQLDAARRNARMPLPEAVPEEFRRIIDRAMQHVPRERHSGAEAFRGEIERFLSGWHGQSEARALCAEANAARTTWTALDYDGLREIEGRLERAEALAPDNREASALLNDVLTVHAGRAVRLGDLELAHLVSARIRDFADRNRMEAVIAVAEEERRRREAQRQRARRIAVFATSAAALIFLAASWLLSLSLRATKLESQRAESALAQSRHELSRATLREAMSHLDHDRDAEAREALRHAPRELRGWEWGYLANAAMPESELLRPRAEAFHGLAVSQDGSLLGAIREENGALLVLDSNGGESAPARAEDKRAWNIVAACGTAAIAAGSADGKVAVFHASGPADEYQLGKTAITAIARDGKGAVLAGDASGTVWRVEDDEAPAVVVEAGSEITALTMKGIAWAAGAADGQVWHGASPEAAVASEFRHAAPVKGFAWNPNGSLVASWAVTSGVTQAANDSRAAVHRPGEAKAVFVREPDGLAITAATWSPGGNRLYLASANTSIFEINADNWSSVRSLLHPAGIVRSMQFLPGGSSLVTFTWRNMEIRSLGDNVTSRSARADSRRILGAVPRASDVILCGTDGGIGRWSTVRSTHARNFQIHRERAWSLDFADAAPVLVSAHQTGKVMVWNSDDPARETVREVAFEKSMKLVRVSADGTMIAAAEEGGLVHTFPHQAKGDQIQQTWKCGSEVTALALDAEGSSFIAALAAGGFATGKLGLPPEPLIKGDASRHWTALEFLPGAHQIIAGADSGDIAVLKADSLRIEREFSGHTAAIRRIEATRDGRFFVSASEDETARLWDVEAGKCVMVYRGSHAAAVTAAVMTPDGSRVITSCMDSVVRVFERESGTELVALEEHQYGVLDMVLSADGSRLFTSGQDSRLRAWFALPSGLPDEVLDNGVAKYRAELKMAH